VDVIARACSTIREERNVIRLFVGQREGGRHHEKQNLVGWMDLGEIRWDGMAWIDLAQDRDHWWVLVNAVKNSRVYKVLGSIRVAAQLVAS
jgi:hypothetical protein